LVVGSYSWSAEVTPIWASHDLWTL
jgi:hypothetical protein